MGREITFNFEPRWADIAAKAEAGLETIRAWVDSMDDPFEKMELIRFAVRTLTFREWSGRDLSIVAALGLHGISLGLAEAEERSGEDAGWFKEAANVLAYNTAANLADAWDDGVPRHSGLFEQGLKAARTAVRLREELKKGPRPFFLAHWACGIHELALGQRESAKASFATSLAFATEAARQAGGSLETSPTSSFDLLLARGYAALVDFNHIQFEAVMKALEARLMLSDEEKEEAEIGLRQLRYVKTRYRL